LADLEPTTREHLHAAFAAYHAKHGRRFEPDWRCVFRNSAAQARVYAEGKSKRIPGHSRHNFRPSYAVDFLLVDTQSAGRRIVEGKSSAEFALYEQVGVEIEAVGLIWGGRWKDPCDPGHCEAPIGTEAAREGKTPDWPAEPADKA
jgi:hypothetical protein